MLQYQTRPGHGTTFGVVLRREFRDTARSAKLAPAFCSLKTTPVWPRTCATCSRRTASRSPSASRGDEGLLRAGRDECDVVLTDLRLPGLGGLELVRQLHEAQPRLPVVLMTAHGTIETAIEATKLGAYDYLQKPFEMPALLRVLHTRRAGRPPHA